MLPPLPHAVALTAVGVITIVLPAQGSVRTGFESFLLQEKGYRDYGHDIDNTDTDVNHNKLEM